MSKKPPDMSKVAELYKTTFADMQSYRTKYVKNVEKGTLGWVFRVLIYRLNVYLKP